MNVGGGVELKENKQVAQSVQTNYPGPGEYPRNRIFNRQDYIVEKYRSQEEYAQTEDISSSQGALYSVSQRVPAISASYSSLSAADGSYTNETSNYPVQQNEWERTVSSDTTKDGSSDVLSDKQTNDSNTTASVKSSIVSGVSNNITNEALQGPIIPTCVYLHGNTAILMEVEDSPTATCELLFQAIINCEELSLNRNLAPQVFALWMTSSLLEVQMKLSQKPYEIRKLWKSFLNQYSHGSFNKMDRDEPRITFQRNVFFPQCLEEKIKDQKILELLYEEAKYNILQGRYPCEVAHYIMLGGIQARIELGPYNPQMHSLHYFREEQYKYLPMHVRKSSTWTWLPISSKNSAEVRLLEQYKRVPASATNRKLMKKYLEFCWSLPFYGSAFFEGQIEQPVKGLASLMTYQDIPVLVALNPRYVYIIDDIKCTVLLGLRYEELSWEYARPSKEDDPNCLPCLFLQFIVVENGIRVSKILQVFSRQASLMDTLITQFVNQIKTKSVDELDHKSVDRHLNDDTHTPNSVGTAHSVTTVPSLTNKLDQLTLATFDEDGNCIGQMGSWSFSSY